MVLYYTWALTEKLLSSIPFGRKVYETVGSVVNRNRKGKRASFTSSFRLVRKGKEIIPPGGTVMDVGTGWFHHDAFLLWLVGDYTIYLFDVADKAKLVYIKNYLQHLRDNIDLLLKELPLEKEITLAKIDSLLKLQSREEIYKVCKFIPCITNKTDKPFLPANSIDFMISNCVLTHIPPHIVVPELKALREMLKPEGRMYFLIGHDDHWAFHDRSVNQFNYYRYSDKYYSSIFDTNFEYQNRMVKQEWLELFANTGLVVDDYYGYITNSSREQIAKLPHIDKRFAQYPREDLAIIYSYFLLRK